MKVNKVLKQKVAVALLVWLSMLAFQKPVESQDVAIKEITERSLLKPDLALDRLQADHSDHAPLLLSQDELDQLIQKDGGGACPIAAGLIVEQTLRSMIGLPLDLHPHRTALRLFQEKPELKEGRISNQRFVELLAFLCKGLEETPVSITTSSAPTSDYETVGTRWNPADGPDLSVAEGQIKILAYTVTTAGGKVLGRHFVLLQTSDGNQISFVNPGRPIKDYTFIVEYRGDSTGPKRQLFFHSPAGFDKSNQTYELNTIFTIRLINKQPGVAKKEEVSVNRIKEQIDQLATLLREQGDLTNPTAWRQHGAAFGLPGLDLPIEVGGSGWSTVDMLEIFRHAGKHNLNLRDVVGAAHGRPLAKSNSAYAKRVLNDIISGKAYVAVAITEPDAGSDMRAMESRATKVGDGYALSGQKLWNARLRQATHVVLYTLASNGKPGARTAFLLPIDHPGLQIVDEFAHGLTGNSFGGLKFNDMFVGPEYVLGEDGDGGKIFNEHFTYWRLMQSAAAIGCGEQRKQKSVAGELQSHFYRGGESLPEFLSRQIGRQMNGGYLEIISPYFDDADHCEPLEELIRLFEPKDVRVFLPRSASGEALVRKELFESVTELPKVGWGRLPKDIMRRGSREENGERFVHAKLYRFFTQSPKREICFLGSPNLTRSAHQKDGNIESGFLVEVPTPRRPEFWLSPDSKTPIEFAVRGEDDGADSGSSPLNIRYNWDTETASAFWDHKATSSVLHIYDRNVPLGEIGPLASREWIELSSEIATAISSILGNTTLVEVHCEGEKPAYVLIQEEGMSHKPSLLLQLSTADILRYWSLLSAEQRAAFIDSRATDLAGMGTGSDLVVKSKIALDNDTLFDRFAGFFHAFGCLERAVRKSLDDGQPKQANYRLFGKKYDSLGTLLERVAAQRETLDAIDGYVILMCCKQLCIELAKDYPDYWREQVDNTKKLNARLTNLASVRDRLLKDSEDGFGDFLNWFDKWFLTRATPVEVADA